MHSRRHSAPSGAIRRLTAVLAGGLLVAGGLNILPATAADVSSATFTGGAGTVSSGGTLYAKAGGALTLTVNTSSDTVCVDVAGALSGHQTSSTAKSTWTFAFTAPAGDGPQAVTVAASPGVNPQGKCTGNTRSAQASYTLDNTGPVVTGSLSPAPNAAGWNKSDVTIAWSATDAGSGVGSGPTPSSDSVNQSTAGATKSATATDRVGNTGSGTVTVKLDKSGPSIASSRAPAANSFGWNNTDVTVSFSCSDNPSGIKTCSGPTTLSNGGANQSVIGSATDNADNAASATVSGINIDKVGPTLSGAATTEPNENGWYNDDVTVQWTASDALSGLAGAAPADSTISGEGQGLTATASVSDKAGNTTSAANAPVRIDRTAPTTAITGASNGWTNGDVTVSLAPNDALSGVATTTYAVDGGAPQNGTSFTLSSEGDHEVTFYSTDRAGNVEQARTAQVRIDKTAPSISHGFSLAGYEDGAWTNEDVTVSFTCTDQGGSGVASCTGDATKTAEGENQTVVGTATDNAGNSTTDTATVSIDKTDPTITGSADRAANEHGWYNNDVTVSFTADDALSGVVSKTDSSTLGQGGNQSVTGTATDAAGNFARTTVTGINIDKTDPVLTASHTGGWHQGDVAVDWTCTDALSGVAVEPEDDVVTGEGDDLTSSATCTDKAGNTAAETVSGIKIDRTAPTTTATVPEALDSGWYAGPVDVTFTGHDALSDVATTYYSVDGGDPQEYTGTFSFGTKGAHTITYWSVDNAGNVEDSSTNVVTLKIDGNPPTTTVINPISPDSGWFVTSGIPVAFRATDDESGVAATYYSIDGGEVRTYGDPFTEELGDGAHTITYWSVDIARNTEEEKSTVVRIDTAPPTISHTLSGVPNGTGWFNQDVTVTFECEDNGSGIDICRADGEDGSSKTLGEGQNQSVTGTAKDQAGNTATDEAKGINVDKTGPATPTFKGWPDGPVYFGSVPAAPTCESSDALSGLASCVVTGGGSSVGQQAFTATATDMAGNTTTATLRYDVLAWTTKGFYSPVDMGGVLNTVKAGSTVPLKFELFAGSTEKTSTSDVQSFTAARVNCSPNATSEDAIEFVTTGGTSLRYDSTAGQFIQNWKIPTGAGLCYSTTMTARDGSRITALFKTK